MRDDRPVEGQVVDGFADRIDAAMFEIFPPDQFQVGIAVTEYLQDILFKKTGETFGLFGAV